MPEIREVWKEKAPSTSPCPCSCQVGPFTAQECAASRGARGEPIPKGTRPVPAWVPGAPRARLQGFGSPEGGNPRWAPQGAGRESGLELSMRMEWR